MQTLDEESDSEEEIYCPPRRRLYGEPVPNARLDMAMNRLSLGQPVADRGPLQETWENEDGEKFHFRGFAACFQRADSQEVVFLPSAAPSVGGYVNAAPGSLVHTVQEWAPRDEQKINVRDGSRPGWETCADCLRRTGRGYN